MQLTLKRARGDWVRARWQDDEGRRGEALLKFVDDEGLLRIASVQITDPTPEKLRRLPLTRIELAARVSGGFPFRTTAAAAQRLRTPRYRLRRPAAKRLGDDFYARVARAYRDAVAHGANPRKAMVEDTGAADATVAGWVMEARRRGHLPPAKPGRVSA